jgi:hypothetical protein
MKPNGALLTFHHKHCPELQLAEDQDQIFYKLLSEIKKLKEGKENEKEKKRRCSKTGR